MYDAQKTSSGFTLTELLIVIVVIAILASISIVTYNGVINRAHNTAVMNDLTKLAETITVDELSTKRIPIDEASLSALDLRVTKNSYGTDLLSGGMKYNLLYCSTVPGAPTSNFAFVAGSKSGSIFFVSGDNTTVRPYPLSHWEGSGRGVICPAVLGVTEAQSNQGVWLYENSIWKVWLKS